jgi:transposase
MDGCPSNLPIEEQSFRRVEVLTGPPRRRRWSVEEKAAVVAASLAPGAVARQVALRHGVHPNQLYAWRRELASIDGAGAEHLAGFVPVALVRPSASPADQVRGLKAYRAGCGTRPETGASVEIALGEALVRVAPGVAMDFLRAVLRAVKSA